MADWNTELQFSSDEADIERETRKADGQLDVLLKTPVPFLLKISHILGAAISYGKPNWKQLPPSLRDDVQEIGFKPCCKILWGHWPLPYMRTPQWIGPEGFTQLEAYHGKRFYLTTLFTDGTAIATTNRSEGGGNALTEYEISSGDFKQDYRDHLDEVRNYMGKANVQPIYSPTPALIRKRFEVLYRLQTPLPAAVAAIATQASLVIGVVALIYKFWAIS